MQLLYDLLINLHSYNHYLISRYYHGNKQKNPRWPLMAAILDIRFLNFCLILRDLLETARKHHFICQNYDIGRNR